MNADDALVESVAEAMGAPEAEAESYLRGLDGEVGNVCRCCGNGHVVATPAGDADSGAGATAGLPAPDDADGEFDDYTCNNAERGACPVAGHYRSQVDRHSDRGVNETARGAGTAATAVSSAIGDAERGLVGAALADGSAD